MLAINVLKLNFAIVLMQHVMWSDHKIYAIILWVKVYLHPDPKSQLAHH